MDFQVKLSKLMNGMGCGLIASWNKLVVFFLKALFSLKQCTAILRVLYVCRLVKADDGYKDVTLAAIQSKLPYLLRYVLSCVLCLL